MKNKDNNDLTCSLDQRSYHLHLIIFKIINYKNPGGATQQQIQLGILDLKINANNLKTFIKNSDPQCRLEINGPEILAP